ncbi:phosphotransferase enzyme family protein [Aspergillus niger]|uniref:non-specific serine/threonine protein kinase n=1 Tax=Aspergillus niger TaxID=5061 RepID=A0A100IJN6_ASPNG|nr:phosphotransferase enzyme family protein [Aspergillus niger]
MSDINHQTYHTRLQQIQRIAQHHSLQITTITPIAYQELGPCPYNNFIYKLELSQPPSSTSFHPPNPHTTSPSDGTTTTYILRMSNPLAMGINPLSSRIENELAAMSLARQGLESHRPGLGSLIPRIYTFCSKPTHPDDLPWTLMEHKSGVPLDEFLPSQSTTIKESIIEQVADILAGLQKCPLPEGITYGGLALSTDGGIISAEMTTTNGGPWSTYEELLRARLRHELHDADSSPIINGWRSNGIRDRLDSLIDRFSLSGLLSDPDTKVLIHGDLTMNNILIDPTTYKLTALIDFDFACIAHPAHEFLVSLQDLGGNVMGPYGEDPTEGKLSQALLSGDFSGENVPGELWWIGKTFNACLAERGVARPSDIGGIGVLCQWRGLEQCVCPFHLAAEFIVGRMSEGARAGAREGAEGEVVERIGGLEGLL